jgi:hypothetical protein
MKLSICIISAFAMIAVPDFAMAGNTPSAAKNAVPPANTIRGLSAPPPPRGTHGAGGDRDRPIVRDHRDGVGRGSGGNGAGGRR